MKFLPIYCWDFDSPVAITYIFWQQLANDVTCNNYFFKIKFLQRSHKQRDANKICIYTILQWYSNLQDIGTAKKALYKVVFINKHDMDTLKEVNKLKVGQHGNTYMMTIFLQYSRQNVFFSQQLPNLFCQTFFSKLRNH